MGAQLTRLQASGNAPQGLSSFDNGGHGLESELHPGGNVLRWTGAMAMKMDPLPQICPTNKDLARGLNQVHDCLEDHKRLTEKNFKTLRGEMTTIKDGLGLQPGQRPSVGTSTPWEAWRRTVFATTTAITSVAVIYKIGLTIGPGVWEAIKALLHAAAHGLI